MKNIKILLSTILIGTAFIGCSSTPDEKTVKSLAVLYNIKSAQENDIKIVKSFDSTCIWYIFLINFIYIFFQYEQILFLNL